MTPLSKQRAGRGKNIPDQFLKQLREDLAWRRIDSGLKCLTSNQAIGEAGDLGQRNAAALLGYLALWVDVGFPGRDLLKDLVSRFSATSPEMLFLLEFSFLVMSGG